ncbi:hypothetical protein GF323_02530 [Candidatus Woesearchaeota archaeon]|nr:hypothetical protein [Candidatus Woesearchaeota archaeon]
MAKRCIICGDNAGFKIKDGNEFYCEECANMQFGDISILVKVGENAGKLKQFIEDKDEFKLNVEDI